MQPVKTGNNGSAVLALDRDSPPGKGEDEAAKGPPTIPGWATEMWVFVASMTCYPTLFFFSERRTPASRLGFRVDAVARSRDSQSLASVIKGYEQVGARPPLPEMRRSRAKVVSSDNKLSHMNRSPTCQNGAKSARLWIGDVRQIQSVCVACTVLRVAGVANHASRGTTRPTAGPLGTRYLLQSARG